jgi:hypothetical protein
MNGTTPADGYPDRIIHATTGEVGLTQAPAPVLHKSGDKSLDVIQSAVLVAESTDGTDPQDIEIEVRFIDTVTGETENAVTLRYRLAAEERISVEGDRLLLSPGQIVAPNMEIQASPQIEVGDDATVEIFAVFARYFAPDVAANLS